jgi:DNA-binding NarL/FixJ family response regulator
MRLLKRLARESRGESSEGGSGRTSREPPEEAPQEADEPLTTHPVATRTGAHQAGPGGSTQSRGAAQIESLTPREVEVLKLLSQGQTNPEIAQNLLFSVSTVKAQVRSILSKLGVSDRTQAAVRAIESRLTISSID